MTTEQRAFPPFRVPGGVAIARRRHFPKYLVKGTGQREGDSDSDSDSDDAEKDRIGYVIVVELPDDESYQVNCYVFTVLGYNFRADPAEIKEMFFNSEPGKEFYQLYTTTFEARKRTLSTEEEFKEPPRFMEENIDIATILYAEDLGKITMVHNYTVGEY